MTELKEKRAYTSHVRQNVVLNGKAVEHQGGLLGIVRASWGLDSTPLDNICVWFRSDRNVQHPYLQREPFFFGDQEMIAVNCNGMIPSRIRMYDDRPAEPYVEGPPGSRIYTMDRPAHWGSQSTETTVYDQLYGRRVLVKRAYYEIACTALFYGGRKSLVDELVKVMTAYIPQLFRRAKTERMGKPLSALHNYPTAFINLVIAARNRVHSPASACGFSHHPGDDVFNTQVPRSKRFAKLHLQDFEDRRELPKQIVSVDDARVADQ